MHQQTHPESQYSHDPSQQMVPQQPQVPYEQYQQDLIDTTVMEEELAMLQFMDEYGIVEWLIASAGDMNLPQETIDKINKISTDIPLKEAALKAAHDHNHLVTINHGYGMTNPEGTTYYSNNATTHQQANGQMAYHYNPGQYGQHGYQANPYYQPQQQQQHPSVSQLIWGGLSRAAGLPAPQQQSYPQQGYYQQPPPQQYSQR